ncbi:MAG: pyridoxamine 5-phosphate oxidase family protein [Flaviaesturariibacter sp.]|nr:pyridoxamine 5-phosphate oxidase family protein [Flaviaesturariibacter sp.]
MFGELTSHQIDAFLKNQLVGRIGCSSAAHETYVVPISYAYDGNAIICHTHEGKKAELMRQNPNVCFEVDDLTDMGNWKSVIVQGRFEELVDRQERHRAMTVLLNRYLPMISSVTVHLGKYWPFPPDDTGEIEGVVFRIAVREKSGRFESNHQSPAFPG